MKPYSPTMLLFAAATLVPAGMLALGALQGGLWFALALVWLTLFAATLDQITALAAPALPADTEFPAADALLVALGLVHLALLALAVWAVAGASGLGLPARMAGFLAFGLYLGQVSVPAAHELIHRGNRRLHALGVAVFTTILFGHHASAHRHVHHRHVATDADPNTARRGESFYAFAPRAWAGSFRAGYQAETARRGRGLHPYMVYLGGAGLCLALAASIAGLPGLIVYCALAGHATAQLLLSDYVQHYGLRRLPLPDGRLEPVGTHHSWNAPHWFSGAMMLNAPRHSDHHAHPQRPYPALGLPDAAPMLPQALPMMAALALLPRRWRRVMDPRLATLSQTSREREAAGAGAAGGDLAG